MEFKDAIGLRYTVKIVVLLMALGGCASVKEKPKSNEDAEIIMTSERDGNSTILTFKTPDGKPVDDKVIFNILDQLPSVLSADNPIKNVKNSNRKDIKKLTKEAKEGDAESAYKLAQIYNSDSKNKKSYKKACHWFEKAFNSGYTDAYSDVAECINSGKSNIEQPLTSIDVIKIAAQQYKYDSNSFIAEHYYNGYLLTKNIEKAKEFFLLSPRDNIALNYLGTMYRDGVGVTIDNKKSREYFTKSSELGLDIAMFNLGLSYLNDEVPGIDQEQAFFWMNKAVVDSNLPMAYFELAKMHLKGLGTPKRRGLALRLFSQASKLGVEKANCFLNMLEEPEAKNSSTRCE